MTNNHRLAKFDHTIFVSIRGSRVQCFNIEDAESYYRMEAEGARALVEYDDGSTETWTW